MSVQIKKNGVWEAVAGNATNTSGITESSALSNIGTSAGATQHEVNVAVDSALSGVMTQFYITNRTEKKDSTIETFLTPRAGKLYLKVTNYSHIDGTGDFTLFYIYKGNDVSSGDLVVSAGNNGIYSVDCTANQPITINHELNAGGMYEMWYVND